MVCSHLTFALFSFVPLIFLHFRLILLPPFHPASHHFSRWLEAGPYHGGEGWDGVLPNCPTPLCEEPSPGRLFPTLKRIATTQQYKLTDFAAASSLTSEVCVCGGELLATQSQTDEWSLVYATLSQEKKMVCSLVMTTFGQLFQDPSVQNVFYIPFFGLRFQWKAIWCVRACMHAYVHVFAPHPFISAKRHCCSHRRYQL